MTLALPGTSQGPANTPSRKVNQKDRFPATAGFIVYDKPVDRQTETMTISVSDMCCKDSEQQWARALAGRLGSPSEKTRRKASKKLASET